MPCAVDVTDAITAAICMYCVDMYMVIEMGGNGVVTEIADLWLSILK